MKTLICILVDESGSMSGNEKEVIDGYNALLQQQRLIKEESSLYLIKFNHEVNVVYSDVDLHNVPPLNEASYRPGGGTALRDAISHGIDTVDSQKKPDEKVILVIITDGYDEHSRFVSEAELKQKIADYTARGDWTFIYIGEAAQEFAAKMGISPKNVIDFCHEKGKIKANFEAASAACSNLRSNKLRASDVLFNN